MALRLVIVLSIVSCAGWGEGHSDVLGQGRLVRVAIPGHRGTLEAVVAGKYIVFRTTGPNPITHVTDRELRRLPSKVRLWDLICTDRAGDQLLGGFQGGRFQLASLPALEIEDQLSVRGIWWGYTRRLLPEKNGWIHVWNHQGLITRFRASPLRVGETGRAKTQKIWGAAIDEKTNKLVLCGDERHIEVFDLESMKSISRSEIDGVEDLQGVCAGDGWAWIGTRRGEFLKFDVAAGQVTRRIRLSKEGRITDVRLDLSPSGRHLAAAACHRVGGKKFPTVLKVFAVEGGRLKEVAAARANIRLIYDLAILEDERAVVLCSQYPTLVWQYGGRRDAVDAEKLRQTVDIARAALQHVRPTFDLSDVRARILDPRMTVSRLESEIGHAMDSLDWGAAFRNVRTPLGNLGLLRGEHADAELPVVDLGSATAVPSKGVILVASEAAGSVRAVSHELGHVLSFRAGYQAIARNRISLRTGTAGGPEWFDLDAILALRCLGEGEAALTAQAVLAYERGGLRAVEAIWGDEVGSDLEKGGRILNGPGDHRTSDGEVPLPGRNKARRLPVRDLGEALYFLGYEASKATFQIRRRGNEPLEDTIARAWRDFQFTTRELLVPGRPPRASRFAEAIRTRGVGELRGAMGATRAGSLLLAMALAQGKALSMSGAQKLATELEDDIIIWNDVDGLLWLTRWATADSAKEFEGAYRRVLPDATVDRDRALVMVTIGDVPARMAWVKRLLRR